MIVDRIYDYLRGDLAQADGAMLDTAARFFRSSLSRNLTSEPQEERRHLAASSPWYCARRILYGINGAERAPLNPRSRLAFLMGDTLEQTGILLSRLAGVDVVSPGIDGKQEGGKVEIAGVPISYHMDQVVRDGAGVLVPVDWKSMADYGFGEFESAIRDPSHKWWTEERWGYLTQLRIYMKAKDAPYGLFVGVNKNTGNMAEMHVPPDPTWWAEMEKRVAYVEKARTATAIVDRPPWATTTIKDGSNLRADGSKGSVEEVQHWRCGYCPFVATCWDGFELVPLKSKPVWRKAVSAEAATAGARSSA